MEHPAGPRSVVLFGYNAWDRADALRPLLASKWRIVPVPDGADRATVVAAFAEADAIFTHRFTSELPAAPL